MIAKMHIRCCNAHDAIWLYQGMTKHDEFITGERSVLTLLKTCSKLKDLKGGLEAHSYAVKSGLVENNMLVGSAIVNMYAKCSLLSASKQVFDNLVFQDVVTWTALVSGYVEHELHNEALQFFEQMRYEGIIPNVFTYASTLRACGNLEAIKTVRNLHMEIEELSVLQRDLVVCNVLVDAYSKCKALMMAQTVFKKLTFRDTVSWTTLIAGYVEHGYVNEAIECFEKMQKEGVPPNSLTYSCILRACCSIGAMDKIQDLYSEITDNHLLQTNIFIASTLVSMHIKYGFIDKAKQLFDKIGTRDVVFWTTFLEGLSDSDLGEESVVYFDQMRLEGVLPNSATYTSMLKSCINTKHVRKGQEVHVVIEAQDLFKSNIILCNAVLDMYMKCGSITNAMDVFDRTQMPNEVSWNILIAGYTEHRYSQKALGLLKQMQQECFLPSTVTFICGLRACASIGAVFRGKEIHAEMNRDCLIKNEIAIGGALVDMYAKCGLLDSAKEVLYTFPVRDVVSWTALIAGYADNGIANEVIECIKLMQIEGITPNKTTFSCSMKAFRNEEGSKKAKELHADIARLGLLEKESDLGANLVDMYVQCGLMIIAHEVFHKLPVKHVDAWTVLISGYAKHGYCEEVLKCFKDVELAGLIPNVQTFVSGLKACSILQEREVGQEMHVAIEKRGLPRNNQLICNTLIDMYTKFGLLQDSRNIFDQLQVKDVVSWNALITGYVNHGNIDEAFRCFQNMRHMDIVPDAVTFTCILKACSATGVAPIGTEIQAEIERMDLTQKHFSLMDMVINMHMMCGSLVKAHETFGKLQHKSIASWNVFMAGYFEHGLSDMVLKCFEQVQHESILPNTSTYVWCLKACGNMGAIENGQELHAEIEKRGLMQTEISLGSLLIDMYIKCALVSSAGVVFRNIPVHDVVLCTTLIAGHARLGQNDRAFQILEAMLDEGIKPDEVTFTVVLSACILEGSISKCQSFFENMTINHGIVPTVEHHMSMIDLLGRAGHIDKAMDFTKRMPYSPNLLLWDKFLGSCRYWGNVEYGKQGFENAMRLDENIPLGFNEGYHMRPYPFLGS